MTRTITMFTGQWADLPLETLAEKVSYWGFDGLELACWGDHFDVQQALEDDGYVGRRWQLLREHGLDCKAISNHLVGQAVCDHPIDERHRGILPDRIWGDGDPEGVRQRAAEEMKDTARAAARFGVDTVAGFSGSSIWHTVAGFPPVPFERIMRALNAVGYGGPLSVEWEDAGMDREVGAPEALKYLRQLDFEPSTQAFDSAFASEKE